MDDQDSKGSEGQEQERGKGKRETLAVLFGAFEKGGGLAGVLGGVPGGSSGGMGSWGWGFWGRHGVCWGCLGGGSWGCVGGSWVRLGEFLWALAG